MSCCHCLLLSLLPRAPSSARFLVLLLLSIAVFAQHRPAKGGCPSLLLWCMSWGDRGPQALGSHPPQRFGHLHSRAQPESKAPAPGIEPSGTACPRPGLLAGGRAATSCVSQAPDASFRGAVLGPRGSTGRERRVVYRCSGSRGSSDMAALHPLGPTQGPVPSGCCLDQLSPGPAGPGNWTCASSGHRETGRIAAATPAALLQHICVATCAGLVLPAASSWGPGEAGDPGHT